LTLEFPGERVDREGRRWWVFVLSLVTSVILTYKWYTTIAPESRWGVKTLRTLRK
jgi:hypothetical protein